MSTTVLLVRPRDIGRLTDRALATRAVGTPDSS